MDAYWEHYGQCLDRVARHGRSADAVLGILNRYFPASSGLAFFPDGADRTLLSTLTETGWTVVWAEAPYHYAVTDPHGISGLTYVEGDVYRGVATPA